MRWIVAVCALAMAAPGAAVTLTFDTPAVATDTQLETSDGFVFGNVSVKNTTGFFPSGYVNGVVSGPNVAFNGDGRPATIAAATPFSLTSGYLAAAWNDGLTFALAGSLGGVPVFNQAFTLDTQHATFAVFNPALIDKVVFTTSGGIHHFGYDAGVGTQFSLDNLTINGVLPPVGPPTGAVPEPAAWSLMIAGFGLVGAAARRRGMRTVAA